MTISLGPFGYLIFEECWDWFDNGLGIGLRFVWDLVWDFFDNWFGYFLGIVWELG
jgi:hypothetical protein